MCVYTHTHTHTHTHTQGPVIIQTEIKITIIMCSNNVRTCTIAVIKKILYLNILLHMK